MAPNFFGRREINTFEGCSSVETVGREPSKEFPAVGRQAPLQNLLVRHRLI